MDEFEIYKEEIRYIRWKDSLVGSGWIHNSDIPAGDKEAPEVISVGFVHCQSDKSITLVANKINSNLNGQVNGYITIPKVSILEQKDITLEKLSY
jgi:hypothetical protein